MASPTTYGGIRPVRVGVEEELIKFKPSPNFRNMKKFLKWRMGECGESPTSDYPESPTQDEINPPLPNEPPPSENPPPPPDLSENTDVENSLKLISPKRECASPEPEVKVEVVDKVQATKPICKDFVRGSCVRVDCRFRHEMDLSQLRGIFVFCHRYQNNINAVCDRPNCRYVHATVFEERQFYRTGILPKALLQPPPPPPPPLPPATQAEGNKEQHNNNFVANMSQPPPQFITPRPESQLKPAPPPSKPEVPNLQRPGNKRSWSDNDEGYSGSSPQDDDSRAMRCKTAKCSTCKVMENRYNFTLKRLEKVFQSSKELELKRMQLEKQNNLFLTVVSVLFTGSGKMSVMGHTQTEVQKLLQRTTESLDQFKEDRKKTAPQTPSFENLLKQLFQPSLFQNANNNMENGSKQFQLPSQNLMQMHSQALPGGGALRLPQQPNATSLPAEQTSPRFNNMENACRQLLSNLLNGW